MGLITGLEEKEKANKKGIRNQHKLLRKDNFCCGIGRMWGRVGQNMKQSTKSCDENTKWCSHDLPFNHNSSQLCLNGNALTAVGALMTLIDFTLSNAR